MEYSIEKKGRFTQIHILGNVDTETTTRKLDNDVTACIAKGQHHFVFNLNKTTYLDSAGISVFVHCLCDIQHHNGSIFLIAADNQVRKVLTMVGITRLIKTYDSEEDFTKEQMAEVP